MQAPVANQSGTLLSNRNFRWLLAGTCVSLLGDQFSIVALPWLVLKLTNDTLVMGGVMAAVSLPRAILILIGGAIVDRFPAKRVLVWARLASAAATLGLAACIALQLDRPEILYALAIAMGTASAFGIPSSTTLLPEIVGIPNLRAANSLTQGARQLSMLAGPALAGLLLAAFHGARGGPETGALAAAFAVDGLSFLIACCTLAGVRVKSPLRSGDGTAVLASLREAFRYFAGDASLSALCIYFAAIGVFISGPLQIAVPVLVKSHLAEGAPAYAALLATYGAGMLAGMAVAGIWPRLRVRSLGTTLLMLDGLTSLMLLGMAGIHALWQAMALSGVIGVCGGFVQIAILTWMQRRVPAAMMGRAMSLFMFIFMAIAPLSASATGVLMRWVDVDIIFIANGLALLAIVTIGLLSPLVRNINDLSGHSGVQTGS